MKNKYAKQTFDHNSIQALQQSAYIFESNDLQTILYQYISLKIGL